MTFIAYLSGYNFRWHITKWDEDLDGIFIAYRPNESFMMFPPDSWNCE